jgi:hypothetical protein
MIAVYAITWFAGLLVSTALLHFTFGNAMLVSMFPEGRRWWFWPSRIAAMLVFAGLVHLHPFSVGA